MPLPRRNWKQRIAIAAGGFLAFVTVVWTLPHWYCGRGAGDWYRGKIDQQTHLAKTVEAWVAADLKRQQYSTGSRQFDGEWLFGTYMMAAMGFGQTALEHPELREHHAELVAKCVDRIVADDVRAFDRESWHEDPLDNVEHGTGHAAYLGYLNLALSMHRLLDPNSRHAALSDRVTAALARRVADSPTMLVATYPNETYPVDNCAVIGSIGLYDRATGADHSDLLRAWSEQCRVAYVDQPTGLLIQSVYANGSVLDGPRGSGTTLGLYMLSFADEPLARELYTATRRELATTLAGFGVTREYPRGVTGRGDIDSGPIVLGYGVSASGFILSGARMFGDERTFRRNFATAYLFGAPRDSGDRYEFVGGGPLGNAILFAMLTAQPVARLAEVTR